jgi:hypothetical protein
MSSELVLKEGLMITGDESSSVADSIFERGWNFNGCKKWLWAAKKTLSDYNSTTAFMQLLLPHAPSLDIAVGC